MRNFFGVFLLASLLSLGSLVEGADVPVDVTGATVALSLDGIPPVSNSWSSSLSIFLADRVTFGYNGASVTSFPLDTNFAIIDTFQLGQDYNGDPASPIAWGTDLNDMDFGALGVHSMSISGEFTFDSNSDEVEWSMDSAPPLVFGPSNEYVLTILGISPQGDLSSPVTEQLIPAGNNDYALVAHLTLVPEPETYLLLGSLLALGALARRRIVA